MKTIIIKRSTILFIVTFLLIVGCNNKANTDEIGYAVEVKELKTQPKTHIVEIKDMKFQPAVLKLHKGDTVVWINKDIVAHDVTEDNKTWASPILAKGESWKKAITKNDSYYCSVHIVMKGKLEIVE